jgi:hypothetical protein
MLSCPLFKGTIRQLTEEGFLNNNSKQISGLYRYYLTKANIYLYINPSH